MEDIKHHTGTRVNTNGPSASSRAERANKCLYARRRSTSRQVDAGEVGEVCLRCGTAGHAR